MSSGDLIDHLTDSQLISIQRIKTWGPNSPTLHNDALKVVDALERMIATESGDITSDPEYQAFVEGQLKYCRCTAGNPPCEGVLAGGLCDEWKEEDDE